MEEYYLERIQHDYPQLQITSFELFGAGEDHIAFAVNGDWIFRFARDAKACRETTRDEANLLTFLQNRSPLAVPLPAYRNEAHGYMGYKKLPGVPLLEVRERFNVRDRSAFPQAIGAFLTVIHATPLDRVRGFVHADPVALVDRREEARTTYAQMRRHIPRALWERLKPFCWHPSRRRYTRRPSPITISASSISW